MYALLMPFVEICLFRRRPQDLPRSRLLMGLCIGAHLITGPAYWATQVELGQAFLASATSTVLLVLLPVSLLMATGYAARIEQTVSALTGADMLLSVVMVTLMMAAGLGPDEASQAEPQLGLAGLMVLGLMVWYIGVFGHILRHALSVSPLVGVLLALVFFSVLVVVLDGLAPVQD